MSNLVDWVRQQLDDDERVARDGRAASWHDMDGMAEAAYKHAIHFDPERMLRQVAAHRAILDLRERTHWGDLAALTALDNAIEQIASIYSDRPGYAEAIGDAP